ncbi:MULTISPECIES: HAMP domain-containing sensor histidine kinase [unclassified Microbacterium]|uniref:sensor histidine kinase n=1 Tax=unclassified Microbacterium TaxID=2609290 RepID=UPI000D518F63|nr:HAMP domain-containing sensor histidine kinase [Microbacterium sp. TPD7012]PVE94015.1 two-component sensor histidine kinase [Microbacterium sp. TPD7012]
MSARLKLTLSYAGIVVFSGILLLAAVGLFLLRYVPDAQIVADIFVPNRSDLLRAFVPVAGVVMVVLIALGLGGGWLLAGRMLAPLDRISDAAKLATQGSLSHRVALEGPRDEFRDLADVFDSMLEQLEAQVAEQQRFAANASHELRTPLAISQTLLEVARTDPERDVDALITRLQEVNARAIELTEALLLLSRAERRSFTREVVDLSLLAEEAVEALLPLADRRGVAVEVGGVAAPVLGSSALLQQLVTNLVLNAVVHNLPSGGAVAVRTHATPHAVALVVENTGEVLPAYRVATLTEPFQRGAERTRDEDHAGVGLGLAIAQRITQAHGGSLVLTPRADGGLIVTVWLPHPYPSPLG